MSLADSILQTASIARCVSEAVTTTNQRKVLRQCKPGQCLAFQRRNDFKSGVRLQESTALPDLREPLLH